MRVEEITSLFEQLNSVSYECNISSVFVGDLLSHVMSKAQEDNILVTVQANVNTLAVASLIDLSCIVFVDGIYVPDNVIQKATDEEIPLFRTDKSAKDVVIQLYKLGIK